VVQPRGACERAVPADADERLDARLGETLGRPRPALGLLELQAPRALEDGPPLLEDVRDGLPVHLDEVAIDHAGVAAPDADDLDALGEGAADDGPDARVHPRGVAPGRVDADAVDFSHRLG